MEVIEEDGVVRFPCKENLKLKAEDSGEKENKYGIRRYKKLNETSEVGSSSGAYCCLLTDDLTGLAEYYASDDDSKNKLVFPVSGSDIGILGCAHVQMYELIETTDGADEWIETQSFNKADSVRIHGEIQGVQTEQLHYIDIYKNQSNPDEDFSVTAFRPIQGKDSDSQQENKEVYRFYRDDVEGDNDKHDDVQEEDVESADETRESYHSDDGASGDEEENDRSEGEVSGSDREESSEEEDSDKGQRSGHDSDSASVQEGELYSPSRPVSDDSTSQVDDIVTTAEDKMASKPPALGSYDSDLEPPEEKRARHSAFEDDS